VSGVFAVAGGGHGGAAEQQRSPGEGDPAVGGHDAAALRAAYRARYATFSRS
jgi:hypothetical protein